MDGMPKLLVNFRFKTGDIAQKIDQNGYKILGRKSVDIIKSKGYKISALEIEKEILECPCVTDVSVIGIPCDKFGEKIVAILSIKPSEKIDLDKLREFLKSRLASYKHPHILRVVGNVPRNSLGKVNKKELLKVFD